jgi:sugar phosphate isomerase/epimerase
MKVGVSSYSFSRYMADGKMDVFGVIKAAKEIGFDGIEFSNLPGSDKEKDIPAFAVRIKDACAEAGLPIVSYTIGANFLTPAEGDWKDEVERLKGEVDIAAILGVKKMRHDATAGPEDKNSLTAFIELLPMLSGACRAVTEYAADKGIKTSVENHGYFLQDSDRCAALMEAVNHPNFGALVDIGNFLCGDDDPLRAVGRMAPYAVHVHAKDFHVKPATADPGDGWFKSRAGRYLRGSIIGHGCVDVKGCLALIKAAGYDDFVDIEFEGMEDNRQALEIGLKNLKRYIEELG